MTDLELIALAKASAKQAELADALLPGLHLVDFTTTIRVVGTISKSADGEFPPPLKIPWEDVLARSLQLCDIERGRCMEVIDTALKECLTMPRGEIDGALSSRAADVALALKSADEAFPRDPKPRAGQLRPALQLSVIGDKQAPGATAAAKGRRGKKAA